LADLSGAPSTPTTNTANQTLVFTRGKGNKLHVINSETL